MDSPSDRRRWQEDAHEAQYSRNAPVGGPLSGMKPSSARSTTMPDLPPPSAFVLLVAGSGAGKSSFLRLLLETSEIAQGASKEQVQSVARFVQGCPGQTTTLRTASIDIDRDGNQPLALTVAYSERVVSETLRFVESRLAEGGEEDWAAHNGDRYLCIYFLDPDHILPPPVAALPVPLVSRTRASSFSQPDQEPVILEPPVTTNPLLHRPTLPLVEISTIRRLSARVNVLPVIARADTLSNDRLAAIKMAIRRDLADNGIGFGIFDVDHFPDDGKPPGDPIINTAANSPPASPAAPSLLRLPYALFSPDIYSHSDGNLQGKFVRTYRWATVDVLDKNHSDFLPLCDAIFHHMNTLQKYTREYLFDKFRIECLPQRPTSRHLAPQHLSSPHLIPLPHGSRPILAIDTAAPRSAPVPRSTTPREISLGGELHSAPPSAGSRLFCFSAASSSKQRTKKINQACNFCRSRKLKCDGGRPSCGQCIKRSNTCDYTAQNKRRNPARRGDESESDSGEDTRSGDFQEPSLSPEISSRRGSNFNTSPSLPLLSERRDELPPINTGPSRANFPGDQRNFFPDNDLPSIATLSLPETSPSTPGPMSAPSLPPLRPASEQQAAQRKRSSTVPGKSKGSRLPSTSGPKVVACNFCRARKTKCDGAHPSCSSCARRLLPCNYAHDSNGHGQRKATSRRPSTSKDSARSTSPPSSRMLPTPSSAGYEAREGDVLIEGEGDLKRSLEHLDAGRPSPPKKLKVDMM
ncbi:GTP binding protein [Roridomyces roridus]|uniref:GTP binding protein n=1 Tax=Roridomyces roridus TaxID=1738132 RepID=A0AAD7FX59_9AGAR|nr:GTP binding protein [Roridomyces roridus]